MNKKSLTFALLAVIFISPGVSLPAYAAATQSEHSSVRQKVVIQVSDNDPKKWNLALNNAENVQEDIGKDKVDIEIVAYGRSVSMTLRHQVSLV